MDPCLRRGGRLEREIDVTGSKLDRFKLLVSLLRAQFTGDNRGVKMRGHSVSTEDIHRVADIIADRTGESFSFSSLVSVDMHPSAANKSNHDSLH